MFIIIHILVDQWQETWHNPVHLSTSMIILSSDSSRDWQWLLPSCGCTTLPSTGCSEEGVFTFQFGGIYLWNPHTKSSIFIFRSRKYIYKYTLFIQISLFICMSRFYISILVYLFVCHVFIFLYLYLYIDKCMHISPQP